MDDRWCSVCVESRDHGFTVLNTSKGRGEREKSVNSKGRSLLLVRAGGFEHDRVYICQTFQVHFFCKEEL